MSDTQTRATVLEKAFDLARSGKCLNVLEIQMRLKAERLSTEQIQGYALKKQLVQLIEEARNAREIR